jgi:hypothetical protein
MYELWFDFDDCGKALRVFVKYYDVVDDSRVSAHQMLPLST